MPEEIDPSYKLRHEIDDRMHELAKLGWSADEIEEFVGQVVDEIRDEEDENGEDA